MNVNAILLFCTERQRPVFNGRTFPDEGMVRGRAKKVSVLPLHMSFNEQRPAASVLISSEN